MDNLPAKQSAFTRIRNNILSAGLSNRFTRSIIANTIPGLFGYGLTSFVLSRDSEDLTGTMQLLSSMNPNAVKANISQIVRSVKRVALGENHYYDDSKDDQIVNMLLDAVREDAKEIVIRELLERSDLLRSSITDETCERIADSIDCQSKTPDQIREIFDLTGRGYIGSATENITFKLFEKLTLDQRKEHFSQVVPMLGRGYYSFSSPDYSQLFEQFPEEDRLDQYKKILEVYENEENSWRKSAHCLSKCFIMLPEEEKAGVLDDTFEVIRASDENDQKGLIASRVLGAISVEEQRRYFKEVLEYNGNTIFQMTEYVSRLDKSLHGEIVYDVITKLRAAMQQNIYGIDSELLKLVKAFEPEVISNALITTLNGNVNDPNTKFAVDLLSRKGMTEFLSTLSQNQQVISKEQLIALQEKGFYVEELAVLFVNLENNRILQSYIDNPDGKSYSDTLRELASLGKDIKFSEQYGRRSDKYDVVLNKKLDTYLQLFSSLDPKERAEHFEETTSLMITEKDITLNYNALGRKTQEVFGLLDKEDQVAQFMNLTETLVSNFGSNISGHIDEMVNQAEPETLDLICDQYIAAFNRGGKENYLKAVTGLISSRIMDGITEKISKSKDISFLDEEELDRILGNQYYEYYHSTKVPEEFNKIVRMFVQTRLGKIRNEYDSLDENSKMQNVDRVMMELSKQIEGFSKYGTQYQTIVTGLQANEINDIFLSLNEEEKPKHFEALFEAFGNLKDDNTKNFYFMNLFRNLDNKTQIELFKNCTSPSSENLKFAAEILKNMSVKELNLIFKGETTLDEETISKLITLQDNITLKTLLFDKDVDREKIVDLSSYDQLQTVAINIDSVIKNIYINTQGKSKEEFNQILSDTYNLFTYNNVPEFMKNFRIFQLGAFYDKQNNNITSFQGKTTDERDRLILEDLFKISLDSNNKSLRDFASIILEGKQLTTRIQGDPDSKISTLTTEELALLNQYRDTLFDLHNLTKEIKNTDRPRIEKSGDVLKDLRTLISVYSDNKDHNPNSRNIIFNPNKILDELFGDFITTTIRPKAMIDYMDKKKAESDERHLKIEQQLKDGTMRLEPGDFIKGIRDFDAYIPSMLRDGVKGGEFNQEHSHSDATPLDADFGYISKINITKANNGKTETATDYEVIGTTISSSYGQDYIVLKNYSERLQDRSSQSFDSGTFTGSPDYYEFGNGDNDDNPTASRYIRTGIPVTDIDYIVSRDWNPKNAYEMAMAGIYIPVVNPKGEVVFTSDEYKRIREEMRGLSHYGADDIIVSKDATNMDALYAVYRGMSKKAPEEVDAEIETVKGLVEGKPDSVTQQKKKAVTQFIRDFFKAHGIRVTDDLSQSLASKSVELIDTGSTGRGTNVPGDGDFDFMLRHNLPPEIIAALSDKVRTLQTPDSEFISVGDGFRTKKVTLPTGEVVDIDVTTAKKSLALSYSSDMCVRDRLNNIRENDPESYNYVQANIIMAKKILKTAGIYKKLGSDGATEHGGFGGIGVENWILQNGGSFKTAIDTFLEAADKASSYDEFKKLYPIFDFGFNHREGKIRHDRFSAFLANDPSKPDIGYAYVKQTLAEIQKALELEKGRQGLETPLIRSISTEGFEEAAKTKSALRSKFSFSQILGYVSKYKAGKDSPEVSETQSSLEEV